MHPLSSSAPVTPVQGGLALILSKNCPHAARTAFSLALAAVAVGDGAAIFCTQGGLSSLVSQGLDPELAELRALCLSEGVALVACADSLHGTNLSAEDLIPQVEFAGIARFYVYARGVSVSLYL